MITLANEGPEAYKPELYGKEIQIIRKISLQQSGYTILDANRRIISRRKDTIDQIMQALSISPENPLCVLHQDIAKIFLIHTDSKKKYQFYMKVSQLDQIKQAYEQSICTVQLLTQRVNVMKQKHFNMLRDLEPLEQEVKKIELRREYEEKRYALTNELKSAHVVRIRQEIIEIQYALDEIETSKNEIDIEIIQQKKAIDGINQVINGYLTEKNDLEQDIDGLRELMAHFSKQKYNFQCLIYSFAQECEKYRSILTEVELKQIYLRKQIHTNEDLNHPSDDIDEQRSRVDQECTDQQEKQIDYEQTIIALINDIDQYDDKIHDQQLIIYFLENELREKQQDLNELIKITQDKMSVYGSWMSDCLKNIEHDQRFQKKPIGPIGCYIQCIDPHWAYAVEKHLAPIMSAFICANSNDEQILLEILSSYTSDYRSPIYVRTYSNELPDISGTLERIREANLLPMCDVLKIDHPIVESVVIDLKQIEATILLENLEEVIRVKESEILNWEIIDRKVKHVVEAWTYDGANIKLNTTFRIYTNEKQTIKYLSINSNQSLSIEEFRNDIRHFHEQIEQVNECISQINIVRQKTVDKLNEAMVVSADNRRKISELRKQLDCLNAKMTAIPDYSLNALRDKAQQYDETYADTIQKYDQSKEQHDKNRQHLADIVENCENIAKKLDAKIHQHNVITENLEIEQTRCNELQKRLKILKNKSRQMNGNILKYESKIKQLNKKRSKKLEEFNVVIRSVQEIQQEFDAITNYLKANEDTNEERREVINQYRIKRDAAKQYKQTYERCYQQIEYLKQFIQKRQDSFLTIADRHEYFLRNKFQKLMDKHDFDDCDIKIDHKKEELEITVRKHQKHLASLSGGERSISTFCFLLALWQSIYQPFRLLDEFDIYMDSEKFQSSLNILYENTLQYSSSQHIVFTPQAVDSQMWNNLSVPVFNMPTPKHSLE
ncbi:hypothetical protein I4U23_007101 [Adineta vaga]|nr:hypothetical protein I4U23_007101 [Adineta vaga]